MARDFTRRQLLLGAGAVSGLAVVGASRADESAVDLARPVARSTGWPDADAWQDLNQRVSGRLIQPVSPLRSCSLDASSAECGTALEAMKNPFFIEDQAGATQSTGWMDAWQGAVSPYAVQADTAEDIAAAVNFARKHGIRLVVKGAGHDYLGRNTAPDSLLVWTHRMRNINVHEAFVPAGTPNGTVGVTALSVGAGTRWLEAYAAATDAGLYVQGGGCTSVGTSGGFIQGGGFGSFSKAFGTGSGGVLEFEVVTADGEVRVVNQHQDPDLFWALRGGGGSTFGIVARTTVLAHPIPNTMGLVSGTIIAKNDTAYEDVVGAVVAFYPVALDNPSWGEQIRFRPDNTVEFALTFLDLDRAGQRRPLLPCSSRCGPNRTASTWTCHSWRSPSSGCGTSRGGRRTIRTSLRSTRGRTNPTTSTGGRETRARSPPTGSPTSLGGCRPRCSSIGRRTQLGCWSMPPSSAI